MKNGKQEYKKKTIKDIKCKQNSNNLIVTRGDKGDRVVITDIPHLALLIGSRKTEH
jgi:hypothetical protein